MGVLGGAPACLVGCSDVPREEVPQLTQSQRRPQWLTCWALRRIWVRVQLVQLKCGAAPQLAFNRLLLLGAHTPTSSALHRVEHWQREDRQQ